MIWPFRRRRRQPFWAGVMSEYDLNRLGAYNAERARGLVHTAAYDREMRALQEMFNRAMREKAWARRDER